MADAHTGAISSALVAAVPVLLRGSLLLLLVSLGMSATLNDALYVLRQPKLLLRMILAMSLLMPAIALLEVTTLVSTPAVRLVLITLAASPIPPFLPAKAFKVGSDTGYTIGLFVAASLVSFLVVPLTLHLADVLLSHPSQVPAHQILKTIALGVLAPLGAGMLFRWFAPRWAQRLREPALAVATLVLLLSFLPVALKLGRPMLTLIGNGTLLAFCVFVAAGLAIGHLLGGPYAEQRPVLALATASRHPGIALALAHATYPEQAAAAPAVLLYLLVSAVVSAPYFRWAKRRRSGPPDARHEIGPVKHAPASAGPRS